MIPQFYSLQIPVFLNSIQNKSLNQLKQLKYIYQQMQDFPEEGLTQFAFYQKDMSNKKSRTQKNIDKIQKLKQDMEDPQLKKQRHAIRRAQDKNKLKKQLQGKNEQQARAFLDAKKLKKKIAKQKILKAITHGQQIYIDCAYEKYMNEKQNKSLAIQTQLIMKSIIHMQNPPGIHLCSVGGLVQKQLEKMCYHFWTLESHKEDIIDVGKAKGKKLIYLSPDAPDPLEVVEIDTAYVIGGLVDRTVKKNASLSRARQLNIEARHLPIQQFMKGRICLNLDHVVSILNKFQSCQNWKEAFEWAAPKRWKKDENQQGTKQNEQGTSKIQQGAKQLGKSPNQSNSQQEDDSEDQKEQKQQTKQQKETTNNQEDP